MTKSPVIVVSSGNHHLITPVFITLVFLVILVPSGKVTVKPSQARVDNVEPAGTPVMGSMGVQSVTSNVIV